MARLLYSTSYKTIILKELVLFAEVCRLCNVLSQLRERIYRELVAC